ncbi:hypothetical protein D3C84_1256280 [compost metagenome]
MGNCLSGLHAFEHQHGHQLGALLSRKTVVGAHQAAGFVETLVDLAKGSALSRQQAVCFMLSQRVGRGC